jgi:hypothetical protein
MSTLQFIVRRVLQEDLSARVSRDVTGRPSSSFSSNGADDGADDEFSAGGVAGSLGGAVSSPIPGVEQKPGVKLNAKMIDFLKALRAKVPTEIPITVTSGFRTPEEQAKALKAKRDGKDNLVALYGDNAKEILAVPNEVGAMTAAINAMIKRGIYMSPHMRGNALDIRSKSWSRDQLAQVEKAVTELGAKPLEEKIPPHLHVTLPS